MPNPPAPNGFYPSAKEFGTILSYGLEDITVTGILLDSYKRSAKYNKVEEIEGQTGITEGIRMSDFRAEISVSGRVISSETFPSKVGDILTINGDKALIMSIDLSASSNGFATIDISATSFEGVTGLEPVA